MQDISAEPRASSGTTSVSTSAKRPREEDYLDEPTARRPPPITARSEALDPASSPRGSSFDDPTGDRSARSATPVESFGISRVANSQIRGVLHGAQKARKQRQLAQALEASQVPAPATVSTSTQQGFGLAPSTAAVVSVVHNPPVSSTASTAYPTTAGAAQGVAMPQQEPKTKPHNGHRLGRDGPFFPHHPHCDTPVPPQFTLGQICQLFPLGIKDEVLKDFFRHGWTPEDIFARWPQDVQQQVNLSYTEQNKHRVMKNRFSQLKKALIRNGQLGIWMASPPRRFDDRQGMTAPVPTMASITPPAANALQPAVILSMQAPMVAVQPLRRQGAQSHATTFAPAFPPNGPKYPHPRDPTVHGLLAPLPSTTKNRHHPQMFLPRPLALASQTISTPPSSLPAANTNRQQQQLRHQMPDMSVNIMPVQAQGASDRYQGPTLEIQRRKMNPQLQSSTNDQVRRTPVERQNQQIGLQVAPRQAQAQTYNALDTIKRDFADRQRSERLTNAEDVRRSGDRTIAASVDGDSGPQQLNYVARPPERQEVHRPSYNTLQQMHRQRFEAAITPTFGNLPREVIRQQEAARQQEATRQQDNGGTSGTFRRQDYGQQRQQEADDPSSRRPEVAESLLSHELEDIEENIQLNTTLLASLEEENDSDADESRRVIKRALQNLRHRRVALEQQESIRRARVESTWNWDFDNLFTETSVDLDADRILPNYVSFPKYVDFGHDANYQVSVSQGDHDASAPSHKTTPAANDTYDSHATIDDLELPQNEQESAAGEDDDDDDDLWVYESTNGKPSGWKRC